MISFLKTISITLIFVLSAYAQDDFLFSRQWALQNVGQEYFQREGKLGFLTIPALSGFDIEWDYKNPLLTNTDKKVVVAVIDSGVDIHHPDLKNVIWENPKCDGKSEKEREKMPCHGWNFLDGNNDLSDDIGHGTFAAGVIAAENNGVGITGLLSQNVEIMPLKFVSKEINWFFHNKKFIIDLVADAIAFAASNGADVINLSIGWPRIVNSKKVRYAIAKAMEMGIFVIAAAGNNGKDMPVYPCSLSGVICVGSVSPDAKVSSFSNWGEKVDLLAPGHFVYSTYPQNLESRILRIAGHERKKGTSFAAPYVAGVAAALKLAFPEEDLNTLKARLFNGATHLEKQDFKTSRFGMISMKKALEKKPAQFLDLDLKSFKEIKVDNLGRFEFKIPYQFLLKDGDFSRGVKMSIFFENSSIQAEKSEFILNKESKEIIYKGAILDGDMDAFQFANIYFRLNERDFSHKVQVVFKREAIEKELSYIEKLPFAAAAYLKNGQKREFFHRVHYMDGRDDLSPSVEYYLRIGGNGKPVNGVYVLNSTLKQTSLLKFEFEKVSDVLDVVKADFNFDGQDDYMVYSIYDGSKEIVFDFFDDKGHPLFGKMSRWVKKGLSLFERFAKSEDRQRIQRFRQITDFGLITYMHPELGKIKVPLLYKKHYLPAEDVVGGGLIDEVINYRMLQNFYLRPVITDDGSVELKERGLQNAKFLSAMKTRFFLGDFDEVFLSESLYSKNGENHFLLSIGEGFVKDYYRVVFKDAMSFKIDSKFIDGNFYAIESDNLFKSKNSDRHLNFITYLDLTRLRILTTVDNNLNRSFLFSTGQWNDPIGGHLGSYMLGEKEVHFVESRYNLHLIEKDKDGNDYGHFKLPINRESSYPGPMFSDSMNSYLLRSEQPAVFINSSDVFGFLVYSMTKNENSFMRPLSLSYHIPSECIALDPTVLSGENYYTFFCKDGNRGRFEYVPLLAPATNNRF